MNGSIELKAMGGRSYTMYGGPYRFRPKGMKGVRMAKEIPIAADVVIPTEDFSVPPIPVLLEGLGKTIDLLKQGHQVYVGCAGGIGRTGLFLASMAKLFGEKDPVAYVRQNYVSHAVETEQQRRYIQDLKFPLRLRMKVLGAKILGLVKRDLTLPR